MRILKLFLACVLAAPLFASAEVEEKDVFTLNREMKCSKARILFEHFEEKFNERMVWIGKVETSNSYMAILSNPEKTTWTMVQFDGVTACVLGSGIQSSKSEI